MTSVLTVNGLTVKTSDNQALINDLSFDVKPGEIYALAGESGSGKSMTALSLMRLLPPGIQISAGQIELDRQDILLWTEQNMQSARGQSLSMIFQEPMLSLNPVMTIQSQLLENVSDKVSLETVKATLKTVRLTDIDRLLKQYPHELSGGMKQRVMIAMALLRQPKILIADEPTTALDVTTQASILSLLTDITATHRMAVILITHDMGVIAQLADRVGIMYQGELVEQGAVKTVISSPKHPYTQALLAALPSRFKRHTTMPILSTTLNESSSSGCAFLNRCSHAIPLCSQQKPTWQAGVRCFVTPEHDLSKAQHQDDNLSVHEHSEKMLTVSSLSKSFVKKHWWGKVSVQKQAVKGIDFEVNVGETLAIVGESGSGKSTTAQLMMQLLSADAGEISLLGASIKNQSKRRFYQQVQMVFQDPYSAMNPKMSIEHILLEGVSVLNPAVLKTVPNYIDDLLFKVGLTPDFKYRYPHQCSGGQRQRIAIARALAVQPKVIIFDEPTSALDVSTQAQVLNLITDLQRESSLSYVFITHDLAVARHVSDRILVMQDGNVVEQGPTEQIFKDPQHHYTQELLAAIATIA